MTQWTTVNDMMLGTGFGPLKRNGEQLAHHPELRDRWGIAPVVVQGKDRWGKPAKFYTATWSLTPAQVAGFRAYTEFLAKPVDWANTVQFRYEAEAFAVAQAAYDAA
jgi:hypothetical protein